MASAEIITIGTELLLGQLVDTNSAAIARALADIGVDVFRETSVGDNEARIAAAVRDALARADVVLCAGGLGPTVDDVTRNAIAVATNRPLELREDVLADLRAWFADHGRAMVENNELQAYAPQGAQVVENPNGTAPGFILESDGKAVIAMPGVPREMLAMLHDRVVPWLRQRFTLEAAIATRVLQTVGVPESEIDMRIADLFRAGVNPSIAVLAHQGTVDVKLTAKAATRQAALELIDTLEPTVRERLGDCIFSSDGLGLESVLGRQLKSRGMTIAAAESFTGGVLASLITSAPGSSAYFRGAVIAYSNEAKIELLGVPTGLLADRGAVSVEVAEAMALGAKSRFGAMLALATTGVAGPDGGSPEKPIGLGFVALANPDGSTLTRRVQLGGDRQAIQRRASVAALALAWRATR